VNPSPRPGGIFTPDIRRNGQPGAWWLPDWVRERVDANASVQDVVAEAIQRVVAAPDEANLLDLRAVFNELSRDPEHAAIVREAIDQAPLGKLLGRSGA
jgi:hypothetical protein